MGTTRLQHFDDLTDDALAARIGHHRTRAQALVGQAKAAGANSPVGIKAREDAANALSLVKAMGEELRERAEFAKNGSKSGGEIRRIDPEKGFEAATGGQKATTHLTASALREAGETAVIASLSAGGQKNLSLTDSTAVVVVAPTIRPLGRPVSILDVIEAQAVSSPTFKYLRQASRTNRAAVVAPGALKPTSEYGVDTIPRELKVIAHLSDGIAEYDLTDVADLQAFVGSELEYGLRLAVERELIQGDGTAGHLNGFAATSGIQTVAYATDLLRTTRKSLTAIEALGYQGAVFVVSPAVLEEIDLAVTGGSGEYLNATAPFDRAEYKLWGVPIVPSTQLPAGVGYLVGADSVRLYTDPGATIRIQWDRASDDFERNLVRARLEGRFEVGVSRPESIVRFSTVSA
ncbi:phage major capsid protein [Williamsia sterculiae]|uniref:Phage major capsid protein, HK97 family n=1 Tax=Williamsia sterculiae TaxID=1344003 RepID=A0A1N7H465_9NOCA|nr:phage major capsid protein [Williamsia sterculiae]SIS19520.1 phage major capsid protein, HK97 family [Williamsia sterculiae]